MSTDTAGLLFGQYRRQLLTLLLLRPHDGFYVRELERLSGMRAGSLHRELTALTAAGLVRRVAEGNRVRYQADKSSSIFTDLANIFRKTSAAAGAGPAPAGIREPSPAYAVARGKPRAKAGGPVSGLKRLGVPKRAIGAICRKWKIDKMWLFGSVTRDDFRPKSDVDVLVEFVKGQGPSLFGLVHIRDEFSALFGGRPVDVVTQSVFRNSYREQSIKRDMQVVYEAR